MKQYNNLIIDNENVNKNIKKIIHEPRSHGIEKQYFGFYKLYQNPELNNIIYIFRQIHILNNELVNLVKKLKKIDKDLLLLIVIIEQEIGSLLQIDYFGDEVESVTNEETGEQYKIKNSKDYIKWKLNLIIKDKELKNKLNNLYEIYGEDLKSSNKTNIIDYIIWILAELFRWSGDIDFLLSNPSRSELFNINFNLNLYINYNKETPEICDTDHLKLVSEQFKKYKISKIENLNEDKKNLPYFSYDVLTYYNLFMLHKLALGSNIKEYFSEERFNKGQGLKQPRPNLNILLRLKYNDTKNMIGASLFRDFGKLNKVENKYFKTEYSEYKELNYTYLLYIIDNIDELLKNFNRNHLNNIKNELEVLIKEYGESKRWSQILLSNWGYNYKPLDKKNKKEYEKNGYISKFDNRLINIRDIFELSKEESEKYENSYLLNIEYKNHIETGALLRFSSDKSYKKLWEELKKLGIKKKKIKWEDLTESIKERIKRTQLVIYSTLENSETELVYKYLLISLWNIYKNIGLRESELVKVKKEVKKEGIEENLLMSTGNIIYVVNNIRKYIMYEYKGGELRLKEETKEGKKLINRLELKINRVNKRIIKKLRNKEIEKKISIWVKYDREDYKVEESMLEEKEEWKRKYSLLKYNNENNYNRIIIDKKYYNPIFLGNMHMLNPYKYEREVEWEEFDYNIYQNPEEQVDYTNIIEIGVENKVKGSTVYVMNEYGLYNNLEYKHRYNIRTFEPSHRVIVPNNSRSYLICMRSKLWFKYEDFEKYIKSGESEISELWENRIIWDKRINLKPNDLIRK